ncbi:unnamed protein product [Adineta ricciae]|uniref:RHD domain-containing protein n=1 Tax=Adineta ricciae TaxID=249248 RepID=A0A814K1M9_ADIRI|nr:unnamed protein product [Adineta ricciae]
MQSIPSSSENETIDVRLKPQFERTEIYVSIIINQSLLTASFPAFTPFSSLPSVEALEIIAQPYHSSKLRYRSDYKSNQNRRGVLLSQNNPNYKNPAIRIPKVYLNSTEQYCIRVCLVTVVNENTNHRYIHPYDLEDIQNEEYNDRQNQAVWYPILEEDVGGIKCFPNLRVVKKKADDIKAYGDLRVLDSMNEQSTPQLTTAKETIKEFNLEISQLTFTVGKKVSNDGVPSLILFSSTTIFSDRMTEHVTRDVDSDIMSRESNTLESPTSALGTPCHMYQYAPRYGYQDTNETVLIFYTSKLKPKIYGDLEVKFECKRTDSLWSQHVLNLEVKDQMVSFQTPIYPYPINQITPVTIVLQQRKRSLESLVYHYLPTDRCANCHKRTMSYTTSVERMNLNKRHRSTPFDDEETTDDACFKQGPSEETKYSASNASIGFSSLSIIDDVDRILLNKMDDSIEALFSDNDLKPFLRISRAFIRKQPQLLHIATQRNHSDLLVKFIPGTNIDLFQSTNHNGESFLLHAARLNRLSVVKALLELKNSAELLDAVNNEGENIVHLMAKDKELKEMLDVFVDYCDRKSINMQERFDKVEKTNRRPLELAFLNQNRSAMRILSKMFH